MSLKPIKCYIILVGGGQLYTDFKGITELKVQGSRLILVSDVLYILNLGVNLFSTKKLYL